MKTLTKFYGKVNEFNPPPEFSIVTLKEFGKDREVQSTVLSATLLKSGIDCTDCEFEVIIEQSIDGTVSGRISKFTRQDLTPNQTESIEREIGEKIGIDWNAEI